MARASPTPPRCGYRGLGVKMRLTAFRFSSVTGIQMWVELSAGITDTAAGLRRLMGIDGSGARPRVRVEAASRRH